MTELTLPPAISPPLCGDIRKEVYDFFVQTLDEAEFSYEAILATDCERLAQLFCQKLPSYWATHFGQCKTCQQYFRDHYLIREEMAVFDD